MFELDGRVIASGCVSIRKKQIMTINGMTINGITRYFSGLKYYFALFSIRES
jgi:hypothetical protein